MEHDIDLLPSIAEIAGVFVGFGAKTFADIPKWRRCWSRSPRSSRALLGIEGPAFRSALAVSYWASMEAIQAWREHVTHRIAKDKGKSAWFKKYLTRIAKVERVY